jgi:2-oxoglutaroyl-CoA hydrolase
MGHQVTATDLGLALDHMDLTLDPEREVARLVIDRPGKLNAITMPMRDQIVEVFRVLERDGRARAVILRGGGEPFTAGGEIARFLEKEPGPISLLHANVAAPERFPGMVIAAVDGYCFGVGLELALACDFRIATTRAVFGQPEIRLGMIPGSGGSQRMMRLAGLSRTRTWSCAAGASRPPRRCSGASCARSWSRTSLRSPPTRSPRN